MGRVGVVATDLECPTGTAWGYGGWDVQTGPWRKFLCCPGISAESLEAGEAGAAWKELGLPGNVVSVGLLTAAAPCFSFTVEQTLPSSRCTSGEPHFWEAGSVWHHNLHWPAISPHGSSVPRITRAQAYGSAPALPLANWVTLSK